VPEELASLTTCESLQHAYFIRSLLESHGIEVFLTNEHATRMMMHPHLAGGVGMQVRGSDLDSAEELLEALEEAALEDEGWTPEPTDEPEMPPAYASEPAPLEEDHYTAPFCPTCGGKRSAPVIRGGWRLVSLLLLGLPLLVFGGVRRCDICGNRWRG
jgi:hypothetical protein